MAAILSRPQCVNLCNVTDGETCFLLLHFHLFSLQYSFLLCMALLFNPATHERYVDTLQIGNLPGNEKYLHINQPKALD